MTVADLPALNASLNALSAVLLAAGYAFVRKRQIARHRLCMLGAFAVSTAFLVSYVVYHAQHGSTPFPATAGFVPAYFRYWCRTCCSRSRSCRSPSHALPCVAGDFAGHRRLAR